MVGPDRGRAIQVEWPYHRWPKLSRALTAGREGQLFSELGSSNPGRGL